MILLLDADSALYRAGCANEDRYYVASIDGNMVGKFNYKAELDKFLEEFPDAEVEKVKTAGPVGISLYNLRECISNMLSLSCTGYELYIGGNGNYRYDYYAEYKSNRKDEDKPLHIEQMKKHLLGKYSAIAVDGEEVDDRVSCRQYELKEQGINSCIVSIDKDLNNSAGLHYNWVTKELYNVTQEEADLNFARQLLTGDRTDGVPGIPKFGEKGALKLLPEYTPDWLDIVKAEYLRRGLTLDYLNQMGVCLWIRRKYGEIWSAS